jgi:hypothetical protein
MALLSGAPGCLEKDPDFMGPGGTEAGGTGSGSGGSSGTDGTAGSSTTGISCTAPEVECGDVCADLMTDRNHCGACFMRCHPAQETCVDGMCMPK